MTDQHKRSILKLAALAAAASALVACGKKDEPAPTAAAPAPAPAAASAPAPAKADPLKIAFAYVGPVGDGGWTFAHDNARKALEKEYGDKIVTSFVESVPESADAERVIRDMAGQGNKLIFGTTFGYMEPMLKVAADNPEVKFEHATGYKTAPNMRTYDSRTYEGAYMAGVIAGRMTKSNTLGVVASIPIPEVIRNINSFTLGAQSSNPNIKTVGEVLDGKWATGQTWWGVKEGAIDLVSLAADVPEEAKKALDDVKAGLKAGSYNIWKGPISDNTGKEVLAKDAVADDKFLGGINFFVKGVEGKVPGDKK